MTLVRAKEKSETTSPARIELIHVDDVSKILDILHRHFRERILF